MNLPSIDDFLRNANLRHGTLENVGPSVRDRLNSSFFTPDEWYEVLIDKCVTPQTTWLDVGCGRELLPGNSVLSTMLSSRANLLIGIDPDPNILDNPYLHEKVQETLDKYEPGETRFDLISVRMVVEHIDNPSTFVMSLQRLLKPGGKVVVYTVNRWSLTSLIASLTPLWFHHLVKSRIWDTEERDTFPVCYRMNTKKRLDHLFTSFNFQPIKSLTLPDLILWKYPRLQKLELITINLSKRIRCPYLDNCIIATYKKKKARHRGSCKPYPKL